MHTPSVLLERGFGSGRVGSGWEGGRVGGGINPPGLHSMCSPWMLCLIYCISDHFHALCCRVCVTRCPHHRSSQVIAVPALVEVRWVCAAPSNTAAWTRPPSQIARPHRLVLLLLPLRRPTAERYSGPAVRMMGTACATGTTTTLDVIGTEVSLL